MDESVVECCQYVADSEDVLVLLSSSGLRGSEISNLILFSVTALTISSIGLCLTTFFSCFGL